MINLPQPLPPHLPNINIPTGIGISPNPQQIEVDRTLIEFIEFFYRSIGVDITYDKFRYLTEGDKVSLLRDININRIIT
jgi:hypothetical protein